MPEQYCTGCDKNQICSTKKDITKLRKLTPVRVTVGKIVKKFFHCHSIVPATRVPYTKKEACRLYGETSVQY